LRTYSCHLGVDLSAIIVKVLVRVPLEHVDAVVNSLQTLLRAGDCKLDHGSRLFRRQLVTISAAGYKSANLHREISITGGADQRSHPVLKSNIVCLVKVVEDRGGPLGEGSIQLLMFLQTEKLSRGSDTRSKGLRILLPSGLLDGILLICFWVSDSLG